MAMDDLIEAARRKDWDLVDERIPQVCNNPHVKKRAVELVNNSNGDVSDLGASILEKAKVLPRGSRQVLLNAMRTNSNQYTRYHSAFALAAHKPGQYVKEVIGVLREAVSDKDVSGIARAYLKKVK